MQRSMWSSLLMPRYFSQASLSSRIVCATITATGALCGAVASEPICEDCARACRRRPLPGAGARGCTRAPNEPSPSAPSATASASPHSSSRESSSGRRSMRLNPMHYPGIGSRFRNSEKFAAEAEAARVDSAAPMECEKRVDSAAGETPHRHRHRARTSTATALQPALG